MTVPAVDTAQSSLREMSSLVTPMALRVAATLRLIDRIADGAASAGELAGATGTHPGALERVLDHLVTVGVLERDPAGGYTPTGAGQQLRDDHPAGLRRDIDIDSGVFGFFVRARMMP